MKKRKEEMREEERGWDRMRENKIWAYEVHWCIEIFKRKRKRKEGKEKILKK